MLLISVLPCWHWCSLLAAILWTEMTFLPKQPSEKQSADSSVFWCKVKTGVILHFLVQKKRQFVTYVNKKCLFHQFYTRSFSFPASPYNVFISQADKNQTAVTFPSKHALVEPLGSIRHIFCMFLLLKHGTRSNDHKNNINIKNQRYHLWA